MTSNRYSKNRNAWRRVYTTKRRKPNTQLFVESVTNVTFSYDLNKTYRHRDFYLLKSNISSSAIVQQDPDFIQYDEGFIYFNNTCSATDNFNIEFGGEPDGIVLSVEETGNFDDNIIVYGIDYNATSLTINLSAPFSGAIRYKAAYSTTGYPISVTSPITSESFKVSAGKLNLNNEFDFTGSSIPISGTNITSQQSTWDENNICDIDVYLQEEGTEIAGSFYSFSGSLSAPINNNIHYMVFSLPSTTVQSASLHDLTHSPSALYNFTNPSRNLDSSGNGAHLASGGSQGTSWAGGGSVYGGTSTSNSSGSYWKQTGSLSMYGLINSYYYTAGYNQVWLLDNSSTLQFAVLEIKDGGIRYYHDDSGGVARILENTSIDIQNKDWFHFGFTRDSAGTGVKLFINGVKVDEGVLSNPPGLHSGTSRIIVGDSNIGTTFASLKVVFSELSEAEMFAEYKLCFGLQ